MCTGSRKKSIIRTAIPTYDKHEINSTCSLLSALDFHLSHLGRQSLGNATISKSVSSCHTSKCNQMTSTVKSFIWFSYYSKLYRLHTHLHFEEWSTNHVMWYYWYMLCCQNCNCFVCLDLKAKRKWSFKNDKQGSNSTFHLKMKWLISQLMSVS